MLDLPETIWIARREYRRFDGIEQVESICTSEDAVRICLDYGYEVQQYVRTAAQPYARRPFTKQQAIRAHEYDPQLDCDWCHGDKTLCDNFECEK